LTIARNFKSGERYNIGGGYVSREMSNIDLVLNILMLMGKDTADWEKDWVQFVPDRKGHDYRYAINCSKLQKELNWLPKTQFIPGLIKTLEWYK
jgi:dTDP-glucose 4,6-dehydratase